jgi:hypothetical protein
MTFRCPSGRLRLSLCVSKTDFSLETFFTFAVIATALVLPNQTIVAVGRLVGYVLVEASTLAGFVGFFV